MAVRKLTALDRIQRNAGLSGPKYVSGGNTWRPTRAANASQQASLGGSYASQQIARRQADLKQSVEGRFGSILDIYGGMMDLTKGFGTTERERLRRATEEAKARDLQGFIGRGTAGDTARLNQERARDLDRQFVEGDIAERVAKLRLGIMEGEAGVRERRTDTLNLPMLAALQTGANAGVNIPGAGGPSIKRGDPIGAWRRPSSQRQPQRPGSILDAMNRGGAVKEGGQTVVPKIPRWKQQNIKVATAQISRIERDILEQKRKILEAEAREQKLRETDRPLWEQRWRKGLDSDRLKAALAEMQKGLQTQINVHTSLTK